MSYPLNDQNIYTDILALRLAQALRQEHLKTDAAVKRIAKAAGANPLTARKWYEGKNAPKAAYLLSLARAYPKVRLLVAEWVGIPGEVHVVSGEPAQPDLPLDEVSSPSFVSINVKIPLSMAGKLNERQLWFLGQLQQKRPVKGSDIAKLWNVSQQTAWRDLGGLVNVRLIKFCGARKNGSYRLL